MKRYESVERVGFSGRLQRVADVLAARGIRQPGMDRIVESVSEEIALVSHQLARVQFDRTRSRSLMTTLECEVGTDLLHMETPRWWYGPNREERWRDRQGLKARRAKLQLDRGKLESGFEQSERTLEDRLLVLIQRRLSLEDTQRNDEYTAAKRGWRR